MWQEEIILKGLTSMNDLKQYTILITGHLVTVFIAKFCTDYFSKLS